MERGSRKLGAAKRAIETEATTVRISAASAWEIAIKVHAGRLRLKEPLDAWMFTCSQVKVDPKVATPAEIMRARRMAIGHQVEGLTGGLEAK